MHLKPTCSFFYFKMSQVQIFIPFKCLASMNCAEHLLSQTQFVTVWFFLVFSSALPDFVLLTNYVNKCGRLKDLKVYPLRVLVECLLYT